MLLNSRQLEAFRHVMLRGSITGAAAVLKVSQPAVSRLVHDLEVRSGIKLFERTGNHVIPTPEAHLLLVEVERYAYGIQAVSTFAEELRNRRRGTLRVVAMPSMAMGFLPRFVASFIKGRSLGRVHLHGMPSHLVLDAVATGQADIGVAAAPPERPGLKLEPFNSSAVVLMQKGHRLARRSSVTAKDLTGEPFISLVEPQIFAADEIQAHLADLQRNAVVTTPLSGIAGSLVVAGTGIALVDPFSVTDFEGRGVVTIPFEPAINVRKAIVTPANRRLSALSQEFIEAFRAHVAAHTAPRTRERLPVRAAAMRSASGETRRAPARPTD
jgi:DNA-binding transcriptional LysR family regulator